MAQDITLELDTRSFAASLRLAEPQLTAAMAKAMNRTIFEMRDAEAAHVAQVFEFAGPSTKGFLTRASGPGQAFRFQLATPTKLEASLFPAPKTGRLLEPHQRGAVRVGGEAGQFSIAGQIATPIAPGTEEGPSPGAVITTARGYYRKRGGRKGRQFIRGKAVLERVGKGKRSKLRVLFALAKKTKLEPRFEFFRVARDAALKVFATKAREEFSKLHRRS